ncbi:DNA polymerase III subunit gamma/tau [Pseudoalteromonas sp. PS5]|uniref:DNA polymerase III subunit gamma/tau n=1 Tax=Pseudoalteromonas sp. PS5 TaxID=1437473 RepID=UPI000FFE829E|nr:DNA polymerase III subunit gamma/tau [Pseudoalteromonas sp. PS5]RXF04845.1 DNA polymerase III subunit gamma/tau [Pseudoalteromonas sp. PS5]
MSYQVLARKWRPQNFHELMGQEHVKQALVNALNEKRLHHAYLFTGTRGVGKTTIARIFAKSLNCEQGVTSTPCGQCSACTEIESGKFIDLIEIDAASRTKVEDTREILDNVQYAPTRGRFKVYLIDEVHMLSKHSFNALLKTLEEPPEHVKFLLATTDPQKLPVTILSRCLQFNLNAMTQDQIVEQLQKILPMEQIEFELSALQTLAKAADGSMRDALSLTDQGIAQTNGNLTLPAAQSMLGLMDSAHAIILLSAVLCHDGEALLDGIERIARQNGNFVSVLDDLIALLHVIQLAQLVPSAARLSNFDNNDIKLFAEQLAPQQGQLLYQLLLNGKKDLKWAPEPKLGFEMVMLRLMAFEKESHVSMSNMPSASQKEAKPSKVGNLRELLKKPTAENTSVASAPQSQQGTAPVAPAPTLPPATPQAPISSAPVGPSSQPEADETQIASQYDSVMSQAVAQGFQEQVVTPQPEYQSASSTFSSAPDEQQSEQAILSSSDDAVESVTSPASTPVSEQQSQAQSAIARILKNRNISGAGKLVGADGEVKKSEAPSAPMQMPKPAAMENVHVEPQVAQTVEPRPVIKKPKKEAFQARHRPIAENLAPELLEQLSPVKQDDNEQKTQVEIPAPENFVSPISDIKFAYQSDDWANMIEKMQLGGRIRQYALHSVFTQEGEQVQLQVDASQQHLDSGVLREKLTESLSVLLEKPVSLEINYIEALSSTPFLVQQQLDEHRLMQAKTAMREDPLVSAFVQEFDAMLDENSVQAL